MSERIVGNVELHNGKVIEVSLPIEWFVYRHHPDFLKYYGHIVDAFTRLASGSPEGKAVAKEELVHYGFISKGLRI